LIRGHVPEGHGIEGRPTKRPPLKFPQSDGVAAAHGIVAQRGDPDAIRIRRRGAGDNREREVMRDARRQTALREFERFGLADHDARRRMRQQMQREGSHDRHRDHRERNESGTARGDQQDQRQSAEDDNGQQ
jgi:hypothetical protein